jgi:hypothetical protein
VLGFHDRGAKAIWSPISPNEFNVINKGVLPWKVETINMNTTCLKDLAMVVKSLKGIL